MSFFLQWTRDGADIPGQIANGYTVTEDDRGHTIFFRVVAENEAGTGTATSLGVYVPTVAPALTISGTPSTSGVVGDAYSFAPIAAGGTAPYTFAITAGTLPSGVTLDTATGVISGTLTTAQTRTGIVLQVTDHVSATASLPAFDVNVVASAVPIANPAALTAMFAAGVGASGGKTYQLAGIDFGVFSTSNHDFSSNPIIILGQTGTKFVSLTLTGVKGVTWKAFNIYGAGSAGVALQVTGGSAHVAFDAVTFNSLAAWGSQSGNGIQVRDSSFITINGRRDASLSDITGRSNGVTLIDSTDCAITNLTLSNIRIDGIRSDGCTRTLIDGNLGYGWFPQTSDHDDFVQWFDSSLNTNTALTITNNGFVNFNGGGVFNGSAQGYFGEHGDNVVIQGNYTLGGLYNGIQRSGGSECLIDDNFLQGFPGYAAKIIVRNGSVNCTVTNNLAQVISNYGGSGANPGFVPAVLPGTNTIIPGAALGYYGDLDAWLLNHPLTPARPV